MATITATATRITVSGTYKAFTSTTGSTSTVINFGSGNAPAVGDAGRFLLWKNTVGNTATWEIRYIESATSTTVTVGDGGFSAAPGTGESFVISTNLADIKTAVSASVTVSGNQYSFGARDWYLTASAFLADVDKSLYMIPAYGSSSDVRWPIDTGCAIQFGRLNGGEANDSIETTQGCHITFAKTGSFTGSVYSSLAVEEVDGPVLNYYGCLIESTVPASGWYLFQRMTGPVRFIGCIFDGPMGGRFYNQASEWVSCRMSGNDNTTVSWSLGATFARDISDVVFYGALCAMKNYLDFGGTVRNTIFSTSCVDVFLLGGNSLSVFDFVDCTTFDDDRIIDAGGASNKGLISQYKSINYTIADGTGAAIDGCKVACYDVDGTLQTAIRTSSSGVVAEILAKFFIYTNDPPSVTKSPFKIRVRKYGYLYQEIGSSVSDPIKQQVRLSTNPATVLSESSAAALTGIAINYGSKTVTITAARTMSQIYDYCQSQLALDANMDEEEFLVSDGSSFTFGANWKLILGASGSITSASGKTVVVSGTGEVQLTNSANTITGLIVSGNLAVDAAVSGLESVDCAGTTDFSIAGTYTIDGCTINEVTNSSGGNVILNVDASTTITTNTGPNITINAPTNTINFTTLVVGSQVVVFDTGTQTEAFRTNSSSTSENTGDIGAGTYDYTVMKAGYIPIRVTGYVLSGDLGIAISQTADPNYASSTGLTYPTDGYSAGVYTIAGTSSLSNFYNFLVETWIAQSSLANVAFPLGLSITGSIGTYNFGTNRLVVSGTFSIDPNIEVFVSSRDAQDNTTTNPLIITSAGTFNLGVFQTINGVDVYSDGTAVQFLGNSTNYFSYYMMYCAGTFNWNGGDIRTFGTLRIDEGAILTVNKGMLFNLGTNYPQLRLSPTTDAGDNNMNVYDLTLNGVINPSRFITKFGFATAAFELLNGQFQQLNNNYPPLFLTDFNNENNICASDVQFELQFASIGANITISNPAKKITYSTTNNRYGYVRVLRDIAISPVDLNGDPISYSYYGTDFNSGNRTIGSNDGGLDANGDPVDQNDLDTKIYSAINQSGALSISLLIEVAINTLGVIVEDDRTDTNEIPIRFIGYTESITTWSTGLYGVGTLTEDLITTPDLSITETNKATVDAYTTIDNAYQWYDRAKSELYDVYVGELVPNVGRSGSQIDIDSENWIIDATAASVYDYATKTIKSSNFTGGAVGDIGTVSIKNGALLTGGTFGINIIIDDSSDGNTYTNITAPKIVHTGTGTVSLNLSGGDVDEIEVTNGATLTVNLSGGAAVPIATETSGTIIINLQTSTLTFENLTSAYVQIQDKTGSAVQTYTNVTGSQVYNTPIGSTGTWSYIVDRVGYSPVTGSYSTTGPDVTINGELVQLLQPDGTVMYTGTTSVLCTVVPNPDGSRLNIRIGDGAVSPQTILNMVEDALATADGLTYQANGGGRVDYALLPSGVFLFLKTNVRLIRDTVTDDNATVGAFCLSTDGQVLDNTNGGIQFLTVTKAQQLAEYINAQIVLDPVDGTDAGYYPFGTPLNPCKTIANCMELKVEFGLNEVFIMNAVTADVGAAGLAFNGNNIYPFDLNNKPFVYCKFSRVRVRGIDADVTVDDEFVDCVISADITARGYFHGCVFDNNGTTVNLTGFPSDFVDCISRTTGVTYISNPEGLDFSVRNWKGTLTIKDMLAGEVSIGSSEGKVTIDATCGGTANIIIRGTTRVVNNSALVIDTDDKAWVQVDYDYDSIAKVSDIAALNDFDPANDVVAHVTLVDTTTTNTDMRGTDGANTVAPDNASITAIKTKTDNLPADPASTTNVTDAQTAIQNDISAISVYVTPTLYTATSFVRVDGDDEGGNLASLQAFDGNLMITGETATGLEVTVNLDTSDQLLTPSLIRIFGYYDGRNSHNVNVLIWNYVSLDWEAKATMYNESSSQEYVIPVNLKHQDPITGEMLIRFLHNPTSYQTSHQLLLDFIVWEKVSTNSAMASDVAAILAYQQQLFKEYSFTRGFTQSATINTITLDSEADTNQGAYDPAIITIISGTGIGQTRIILEYDGPTRTAVVHRDWKVIPDISSEYAVQAYVDMQSVNEGFIRASTTNTVKLNANASTDDGVYVGQTIFFMSGTGQDQSRIVTAYDGATQTATLANDLSIALGADTAYTMLPHGYAMLAPIVHTDAIVGGLKDSDITSIKAKTDNLPADPASTTDITSLNDFDPANDVVAHVTLVDTTTTNTDMRGTDGANTVAPDNASITTIKDKTDNLPVDPASTTDITGLNNFDPAVDVVARVTLVDTTTTNTDMRGTDGANTVAPDNTSITNILSDTNELQTNQGNWLTATGFATPTNVSDAQISIQNDIGALNDLSSSDIASELATYDAPTKAELDSAVSPLATSVEIAALNDLSAAEVKTQADQALVDYDVATSADVTGVDVSANVSAIKAKTDKLNFVGTDVKATLDNELVATDATSRKKSQAKMTVSL